MFACKWRNFKIISLNEVETLNTKNTTLAKIQILALTISWVHLVFVSSLILFTSSSLVLTL